MKQLKLQSQGHGGVREGAGRKRSKNAGVSHAKRPQVESRHPLHITVRLAKGAPSLRRHRTFRVFCKACKGAADHGVRVLQYAVLGNHFHILVESDSKEALTKGMRSLNIRVAKGLNAIADRKGRVQHDRFHAVPLTTPTQLKRVLVYIFTNAAKHSGGRKASDDYNSYALFEGQLEGGPWNWRRPRCAVPDYAREAVSQAKSWLARVGWRRASA